MDAEEGSARIKDAYRNQVKKRGSQAEASRLLGRHEPWVNGQLKHPAGMRTGHHLRSLERLGCRLPQESFHQALFSLDTDPAAMLEFAREFQKLPRDPFLGNLEPRLVALATAEGVAEGSAWQNQGEEIARLDQLRRRDRDLAKAQLQLLLLAMLHEIENAEAKSRQGLGELTRALGVLAAIYRLAGRRDDAVDLLIASWPLARPAGARAKAEWYQKSAYLLVDLNQNTRAYNFVLEAHRFYDIAGDESSRLRTLVDSAYVLTHAGYHEQSREMLEPLLARLPESDTEGRLSAHQILGKNCQSLGDLDGARGHLDAAIALVGDDSLARASCLWRRGRLLVEMGDAPQAMASFAEAMPLQAKLSGAAELAELAMEYSSLLLKERRRPELRVLAADLAIWLDELKANLKLREAIADFHSLVELDILDGYALAAIVRQVQALKTAKSPRQR